MVTKRLFLLTLVMALLSLTSEFASAFPIGVQLQVRWGDPIDDKDNTHRGPVLIPSICIEDYTLYFDTPCDGCTLRVVNEDGDVEYTTVIADGTDELELPSYLESEYELQIVRGNFCFYGIIEL